MPYLVIVIDVTKGRLTETEHHDSELSAIFQQSHSACVMRALPQELYDTEATPVGEVRFQEGPPGMSHLTYSTGKEGNNKGQLAKKNKGDGKRPRSKRTPSATERAYEKGRGSGRAAFRVKRR